MNEIFPKFSSKGKGKQQVNAVKPPAHVLKFLAKCDVEIGPHIFSGTSFYEASYAHEATNVNTLLGATQPSAFGQQATAGGSSASLLAPIDAAVDVTPQLIAQVNEAASANPILQNLLQQAAMGLASLEQLQTLGILIQSLAAQQRQAAEESSSSAGAQFL